MKLLRFAIVSVGGPMGAWHSFTVEHDGVTVTTVPGWNQDQPGESLVAASVELRDPPQPDSAGLVEVPNGARRAAEGAIEVAANAISVATGKGRMLSSPRLPVAFKAESAADRAWMDGAVTLASSEVGIAAGRLEIGFDETDMASLLDRDAGVALMSEALGQGHLTSRLRVLLLLFEQAFTSAPGRLVPLLSELLASRPGLGYERSEVKLWIEQLRGRAMHADRRAPLLEVDARGVIDRVLLAAYEVLFNKTTWGTKDSFRRDRWTPSAGPLDRHGRWFVVQHSTPTVSTQLYDAFGAYPLALNSPGFGLGDDCWPREPPSRIRAPQETTSVIPAQQLAVNSATA